MQCPGGAPNVVGHAGSFASRAASFVDASVTPPLLLVDPLDDPPLLDDDDDDDDDVVGPLSTTATPPPHAATNESVATMERPLTT